LFVCLFVFIFFVFVGLQGFLHIVKYRDNDHTPLDSTLLLCFQDRRRKEKNKEKRRKNKQKYFVGFVVCRLIKF